MAECYRVTVLLVQMESDGWGGADRGVETKVAHVTSIWSHKSVWKLCPPDPPFFHKPIIQLKTDLQQTSIVEPLEGETQQNWSQVWEVEPMCGALPTGPFQPPLVPIYKHTNLLELNAEHMHHFHLSGCTPPPHSVAGRSLRANANANATPHRTLGMWRSFGGSANVLWLLLSAAVGLRSLSL